MNKFLTELMKKIKFNVLSEFAGLCFLLPFEEKKWHFKNRNSKTAKKINTWDFWPSQITPFSWLHRGGDDLCPDVTVDTEGQGRGVQNILVHRGFVESDARVELEDSKPGAAYSIDRACESSQDLKITIELNFIIILTQMNEFISI